MHFEKCYKPSEWQTGMDFLIDIFMLKLNLK